MDSCLYNRKKNHFLKISSVISSENSAFNICFLNKNVRFLRIKIMETLLSTLNVMAGSHDLSRMCEE